MTLPFTVTLRLDHSRLVARAIVLLVRSSGRTPASGSISIAMSRPLLRNTCLVAQVVFLFW